MLGENKSICLTIMRISIISCVLFVSWAINQNKRLCPIQHLIKMNRLLSLTPLATMHQMWALSISDLLLFHQSGQQLHTIQSKWDFLCLRFVRVVFKQICCNWKRVASECIRCLFEFVLVNCNWIRIYTNTSARWVYDVRERHSSCIFHARNDQQKGLLNIHRICLYGLSSCACSWQCVHVHIDSHTSYTYTKDSDAVSMHSHRRGNLCVDALVWV